MKRIILTLLVFGLLSTTVHAKKLAYCIGNFVNLKICAEYTDTDIKKIENAKTLGKMYSLGWRLITVTSNGEKMYFLEK